MKKIKTPTRSAVPRSQPMAVLGQAALAGTTGGSGDTIGTTGGSGTTQLSYNGSHGC